MSTTTRPVLAIVGATGAQGGGLARAVLDDPRPTHAVRAITRAPDSARARALAARGAEVVQADLDDRASLVAALAGADAAYLVTNYWELLDPEREQAQIRHLIDAVHAAGVRHVVWSTLEDTRRQLDPGDARFPVLHRRFRVPHFDAKGEMDRAFRERGIPTTFFRVSFYWENLIHFGMGPRRAADGTLELRLPLGTARLAGIAAEDVGRCAYGVLRQGETFVGQTIGVAGEQLTGRAMADALARALGEPVRWVDVAVSDYRALDFASADDLASMFLHHQECEDEVLAVRSVARSRALNPRLLSFDRWLARHAAELPIEPAPAPAG